tara:strand:- start:926 stop:2155 length:1230 start_codon:yes stop_codon:yes gene_type:complete
MLDGFRIWIALFFERFNQNNLSKWSMRLLLIMVIVSFLADFIASDKPIVFKSGNQWFFPVLGSSGKDIQEFDFKLMPLIPYSPASLDYKNSLKGPFDNQILSHWSKRHWLGTDDLGRDIFSGMIHGIRYVLLIGFGAMFIAFLIGVFMGAVAGFYGDYDYRISYLDIVFLSTLIPVGLFFIFESRFYIILDALKNGSMDLFLEIGIFSLILIGVLRFKKFIYNKLKLNSWWLKSMCIPIDIIINRCIEVTVSIPVLFLILSIIALLKPSFELLILVIGLTYWTGIARFLRAEVLKVKNLNYIEAAKTLGYSDWRILLRHILPNTIGPVLISLSFGVANTVLIEATLSFLGIVPGNYITWGVLLKGAREFSSPWWIAVFPGIGIFITVTMFNLIGEGISDANNPKIHQDE